jgi:hypothetical protein
LRGRYEWDLIENLQSNIDKGVSEKRSLNNLRVNPFLILHLQLVLLEEILHIPE